MYEAVGDAAWLQAMLDAEAALALAEAGAGVIPRDAADAIAAAADGAERFDVEAIRRAGRSTRNPVPPLVSALREVVGPDAAEFVHWGAADQDIVDTAAVLIARRGLDLIRDDLDALADACAALADEHRATPMPAGAGFRGPAAVTLGHTAAGWLVAATEAWSGLTAVGTTRMAAQLGGPSGMLESLGDRGIDVLRRFTDELDVAEPVVPWHSQRARFAELAAALAIAAGALAKIALDVEAITPSEHGEAAGSGDSGGAAVRACAGRVRGAAGTLIAGMTQADESTADRSHADWEALREALALTGGAAAATRRLVEGLAEGSASLQTKPPESGPPAASAFVDRALAAYREQR